MRICIDSCVFIQDLQGLDTAASRVLALVSPQLVLLIPRLVAQEVVRNLGTPEQVRRFYRLFQDCGFAFIVDEPVPATLVRKYVRLGLPEKADAYIGAFAEWLQLGYLISDNRHFLRGLQAEVFTVLDPDTFVSKWESGTL